MRKQFKPLIKHDVVTQTYTIRDKKGVVIQVPDVIIDELDNYYKEENEKLKTQKIAFQRSYKQAYEENEKLEQENEKLIVKRNLFFERWKFKSEMYTELYEESDKYKLLLSEISQHIGNKPSSSTYKYFRAKLDGIGIKVGE